VLEPLAPPDQRAPYHQPVHVVAGADAQLHQKSRTLERLGMLTDCSLRSMKALKLELYCQSYAAESSVGSQFQAEHIDSLLAKILFGVGRDIRCCLFRAWH
jgi:phage terminase small subunit